MAHGVRRSPSPPIAPGSQCATTLRRRESEVSKSTTTAERRATLESRNSEILTVSRRCLSCFRCGQNFNKLDLLMRQGYDFVPAVEILQHWLRQYQEDRGGVKS